MLPVQTPGANQTKKTNTAIPAKSLGQKVDSNH